MNKLRLSQTERRGLSAQERRKDVVGRAAALFDGFGYSSASMADIAHEVGIAKATLYHYFKGKDEILFDIHEEFIDLLIAQHRERSTSVTRPREQLLGMMTDILDLMETHRGHVRVFFEHYRELPRLQQETIRQKRDVYESMVEEVFAAGISQQEFSNLDVRLSTLATFGMCIGSYHWYRAGGPMSTRRSPEASGRSCSTASVPTTGTRRGKLDQGVSRRTRVARASGQGAR